LKLLAVVDLLTLVSQRKSCITVASAAVSAAAADPGDVTDVSIVDDF